MNRNQMNSGGGCGRRCSDFSRGAFYSIFFSLHDNCPGTPPMSHRQAMAFVQDVCAHHFQNGFTILDGSGANRGCSTHVEPSIYIMAINATEHSVFQVARILQRQFRQSEVLIEKNQTQYRYFRG